MLPPAELPRQKPQVAYFCAEYGLADHLPFYAGGLGILAGDVLKQAADEDFPMVGVGLFYHGKRDRQVVAPDGDQSYQDYAFDPLEMGFSEVLGADGQSWHYQLPLGGELVYVYALAKKLSPNVTVYFLETDRDINAWQWRDLTLAPYWGDQRAQVAQQFVLGCAGVRLLADLGLLPETFHLNEGRPAFLIWELAVWLKENQGLSGHEAIAQARSRMVYTNHTLVKAGNMSYPFGLMDEFIQPWVQQLDIPAMELLSAGLGTSAEKFEITQFALNSSRKASGVSEPHTQLCREQWPEFNWVNVTNGVHFPTWQGPAWASEEFGDDVALWYAHLQGKRTLAAEAYQRTGITYDPGRLVLGWARRITGYKRLDSLLFDVEQLRQIMADEARPVQLVIAGKAHPGDEAGIRLLQHVIQTFQRELSGLALYIPNYDIALARQLVSGVDVWLNTPEAGHEACGTSGMKAAANGVLQATVRDGWTDEVNWDGIGWELDQAHPGEHLYKLLTDEIKPLYYQRENGLPREWIARMRRTLELSRHYSAARLLRQYRENLYT